MDYSLKEAHKKICKLINEFEENEGFHLSPQYQEIDVRNDYISPFYHFLGWDVLHKEQKNPYKQEVQVEKSVTIGNSKKKADYAFHLEPNFRDPIFYIEAKKPARDLTNNDDYFQLIRYAWHSSIPVSILTDFEEFHIIDCRGKPVIGGAVNRCIKKYYYTDFKDIEVFSEIYFLFSRQSVLEGSLDKFIADLPPVPKTPTQRGLFKGGYASIDDSFLADLDDIRYMLAVSLYMNNTLVTEQQLTEATQRIIDRLVFIRFLEDKLIEPDTHIDKYGANGDTWKDFIDNSRKLAVKYNGAVFKKHFIDETNFVGPKEKVFSGICEDICHLNSIYDFNKIPIHIIGSIYERFLAKVIVIKNDSVEVVQKPEVNKAGGVYYTPQSIVRYIVDQTIGPLIKEKSPIQISRMRFGDIACGSGSFLITVFEYLLDFLSAFYQNAPDIAQRDGCYYVKEDDIWVLSLAQKKSILLNNIFGVDIDEQAVEVSQLSLYLKLLEDETTATANDMLVLFHEKILPDLSSNIKCGNSLIDPSYFSNSKNNSIFDNDEFEKINVFDWENEFTEVFGKDKKGFDAIVGNPPYIKEYTNADAFKFKHSKSGVYYQGKMDIWYAFACLSIDLLKDNGNYGIIATNNWISNSGAKLLRKKITSDTKIIRYIDFNDYKIFKTASIQTMILVAQKKSTKNSYELDYTKLNGDKLVGDELSTFVLGDFTSESSKNIADTFLSRMSGGTNEGSPIHFNDLKIEVVVDVIESGQNYFLQKDEIGQGIVTPQDAINKKSLETLSNPSLTLGDGIYVISTHEKDKLSLSAEESNILKPLYTSVELHKVYADKNNSFWIIYADRDFIDNINSYPKLKKHLDVFSSVMTSSNKPYGLHRPRDKRFFDSDRVLSLRKTFSPNFTFVNFEGCFLQTYNIIKPNKIDCKLLTGILNSNLAYFWFYYRGKLQGNNLQIDKEPLMKFPIRKNVEKNLKKQIKQCVDNLSHARFISMGGVSDKEKSLNVNRINIIESELNNLVYELYELDDSAIKIIYEFISDRKRLESN